MRVVFTAEPARAILGPSCTCRPLSACPGTPGSRQPLASWLEWILPQAGWNRHSPGRLWSRTGKLAAARFGLPGLADDADPDHDGLTNLWERAFLSAIPSLRNPPKWAK